MLSLLSLPLIALNGTVLAASVWEYVSTSTWQPATDCAPACSGNTTCCHDAASGQAQGACFNAPSCDKIQDVNVTLAQRLVAMKLDTGIATPTDGLPMAPHSGVTLPLVNVPEVQGVLAHIVLAGPPITAQLVLYGDGGRGSPMRCALDEPLVALFKSNAVGTRFDVVGVPLSAPTTLIKINPPLRDMPDQPCVLWGTLDGRLPVPIYHNETIHPTPTSNYTVRDPAKYTVLQDLNAWPLKSILYYIDAPRRSLLGINLSAVSYDNDTHPLPVIYNKSDWHMDLSYVDLHAADQNTLLLGSRSDALLVVDAENASEPTGYFHAPNASGGLWSAGGGVVVYETRPTAEQTGFAAARLSDQSLIVSSPPLQGECTKPAYSCMMDYLAYFPEP